MKKMFSVAAIAVAMSIPAGAAITAIPGTAGAASTIACSSLKGTATTTITISLCTPTGGAGYKSATGPAASLANGGNITWTTSKATTTLAAGTVTQVAVNKCGTKGKEYSYLSSVSAASTSGAGIPKVGDTASALVCVSSTLVIVLLPNTKVHL